MVHRFCYRLGCIRFPKICQHKGTVSKEYCKQHLCGIPGAFYRIHFHHVEIRMSFHKSFKIFVGTPDMAFLIDTYNLFGFAFFITHFSWKIYISSRKYAGIYVVINGPFIYHDFCCIVHTNLMNRLALFDKRRKDGIKPIQFFWCYIDTLTGIRTCLFVCFMSFLCIIELFGKSTGTYLFT